MTETDEFLEHFGVKGMRWGVRKNKSDQKSTSSGKKKFARNVAISVTAGAAVGVVGGYAVKRILASRGANVKLSSLRNDPAKKNTIKIGREQALRIRQQRKTFREISTAHKQTVKEANEHIKEGYKLLDTPIRLREYL